MELIKLCVEQAEMEALLRAEEAKKKLEEEEATKTAGWYFISMFIYHGLI
jgi:hypothetical protein